MNGMQGFTMGDAAYHRNEPDLKRELAQAKELLANQTAYIKVLQEENLRLNKLAGNENFGLACAEYRQQLAEQEALIAELKEALEACVRFDSGAIADAIKTLEKVVK